MVPLWIASSASLKFSKTVEEESTFRRPVYERTEIDPLKFQPFEYYLSEVTDPSFFGLNVVYFTWR